jgi:hypothetical protein
MQMLFCINLKLLPEKQRGQVRVARNDIMIWFAVMVMLSRQNQRRFSMTSEAKFAITMGNEHGGRFWLENREISVYYNDKEVIILIST